MVSFFHTLLYKGMRYAPCTAHKILSTCKVDLKLTIRTLSVTYKRIPMFSDNGLRSVGQL